MPKKKAKSRRPQKRKKYKYSINYIDPKDPQGMRDKTWRFKTQREAERERRDIASFWGIPKYDVEIDEIEYKIPLRRKFDGKTFTYHSPHKNKRSAEKITKDLKKTLKSKHNVELKTRTVRFPGHSPSKYGIYIRYPGKSQPRIRSARKKRK